MTNYFAALASPLGTLMLTSDGEHLTGLLMDEDLLGGRASDGASQRLAPSLARPANKLEEVYIEDRKVLKPALDQVRAYLAGELKAFDLPLKQPGTPFQQNVWKQLQRIDYGVTASYQDVAKKIQKPQAMRAVGTANGRNKIAIVVPCHRVIAADGTLGGYGGGLWRKEWLLNLERR